ncbi:hypothetical protein Plhal304r1_c095g0173331 [Plasmopara halstedii]
MNNFAVQFCGQILVRRGVRRRLSNQKACYCSRGKIGGCRRITVISYEASRRQKHLYIPFHGPTLYR